MANDSNLVLDSAPAGEDLSAKQYYLVKTNSSGLAVLAGLGEVGYPLQNAPTSGKEAVFAISGKSKVVAGGTVTAGGPIKSSAAGKALDAVKGRTDTSDSGAAVDALLGSNVVGIAKTGTTTDGVVVEYYVHQMGAVPTTPA